MKSDIEIQKEVTLKNINEIAKKLDINEDALECYGKYKAKVDSSKINSNKIGKLVLVTAINPTPYGEGKTTTSVGLVEALNALGKKTVGALREPSLGPVMGKKGGATGGGYAQVAPMEEINLHFTGDLHAITSAHNLLCSMIDNHIYFGHEPKIDKVTVKRAIDCNDRALRSTIVGLNTAKGYIREDGFIITVASEIMAILCLSNNIFELKEKLSKMIVGTKEDGSPVYVKDIKAEGAMTVLLKEAIKPNLVQTLEGNACFIHGGPFANIAHGCNSITATKLALKLGDIAVTEAGFGSDLGAEKFFDIKSRMNDLNPECVVLVATIRALKYNGYHDEKTLTEENLETLEKGFANLKGHIENLKKFGVPVVVSLNVFNTDTEKEIAFIEENVTSLGASFAKSYVFAQGSKGGLDLANKVLEALDKPSNFKPLYDLSLTIEQKVNTIAKEIYGASTVTFSGKAKKMLGYIDALGLNNLPVCIAKTPSSFTDDAKVLGRPTGFNITVKDISISNGAGFIVIYCGEVMTMPALPKSPLAYQIDIDEDGNTIGLS